MTMPTEPIAQSRVFSIGISAVVLLVVTVALGLFLGDRTRNQFREIEASWESYDTMVGQNGYWISSIRGHLGYGGIIHNFKNYILRQDQEYYDRTQEQIEHFDAAITQYLDQPLDPNEREALVAIKAAIGEYAVNLLVVRHSVSEGMTISEIDRLVAIDDSNAISALSNLESVWLASRTESSERIVAAVAQGQTLIGIGFASLGALVLASCAIGILLIFMLSDLRRTMLRLSNELATRRKLERSEKRLASAVEQSPATIFITDTDAKILYANRSFTELTGWSREEVEGRTPRFLQSGDTRPEVYAEIRDHLKQGKEWAGVFRNRKKDGSSYWSETRILPLVGPDGNVQNYLGIGEDLTERRQAREQVARAQKLEAVGLLAGGIAHDFNNVLTTIIGAAHLAALDATKGSDLAGEIEQIEIAAQRAQSLVHGLLTFARREPGQPKPNDLCAVVREVSRLLRASLPPVITLSLEPDNARFMVMADRTHLHQIVMNLCRNAAEAIGGAEGVITMKIAHVGSEMPDGLITRPEGWVCLEIRDNGPGMSPETRSHLFDPFFTTKPLGKGSGLGLVVVAGLVEEMGGMVSVDSQAGEGAVFYVYFPATPQDEAPFEATEKLAPRGTEQLILVDDQPEVAATFRRVLLRLGYRVEAYTSPVVALEAIRENPARYELLITDMVMPDMNGETLANSVRKIRSDLPIIVCTGYNPAGMEFMGDPPEVLDKPVDPTLLARTVRVKLDAAKILLDDTI